MNRFLIIWAGQLISLIGSGLTSFALGVWILEQSGRATPFSLVVLLATLPRILLAPLAGSLADRWNRRRIMILADSGDALVTLATALLLLSGRLAVWHVALLAPLSAAFAAFQSPAYAASVVMLVPKEHLPRANGLMQMGRAIEILLAPTLAGVLFGWVGMEGVVLIDFASYVFAIGALLVVRIPQPQASTMAPREGRGVLLRDLAFGWGYLRERAGLLGLLLYFALANFALNLSVVLMGPLVLSFGTADTFGVLRTVCGVGMLVGSIALSVWGGPRHRVSGAIGSVGLGALGLMLAGIRPVGGVVGAGLFLLLFCIPIAAGLSRVVFQSKIEPAAQGRVMAVSEILSHSMMPLAYLISGPLADYVCEPWMREGGLLATTIIGEMIGVGAGRGIGLMFVISGLVLLLASGVTLANPRVRRIEVEITDAVVGQPELTPEERPSAGEPVLAFTA
jgi:MFS family permease